MPPNRLQTAVEALLIGVLAGYVLALHQRRGMSPARKERLRQANRKLVNLAYTNAIHATEGENHASGEG